MRPGVAERRGGAGPRGGERMIASMEHDRPDEKPRPFTPFPEQDENSVDLTLLRENLGPMATSLAGR